VERRWWLALGLVTLLAAVLRLITLSTVPENLFYDAAVRSMGLSLHNFLYGAFDPTATTAIDKPPIDLWLQVIAVKLFGFNSVVLKLPEAIAGTLAIPVLYDVVRRVAGPLAGLCSAMTLALLPTAVITARSDTMDSLMMLLLLVVAWLLVRAMERRTMRPLFIAAVVLGIAFNVKLFEALVPVPAFVLFIWLCWRGERVGARLLRIAEVGAVFAAVALCWMVFVSLSPAHDRPYAIGSTNGSVWNSVFVFDGWDRIVKPPAPASFSTKSASAPDAPAVPAPLARAASAPAAHAAAAPAARAASVPTAHAAAAVATPAVHGINSKPGPLRLFQYSLVGYGTRIGTLLFAAIVFGLAALAPLARRRLRAPAQAGRAELVGWAGIFGVALWLLTGYALFSFSGHTQPRYLEAFTPAVAIALGCALPVLVARARDLFGVYVLMAAFAIVMAEGAAETASGKHGYLAIAIAALLAVPVTLYVGLGFLRRVRLRRWPAWYSPLLVTLAMAGALLAMPAVRDVLLIRDHSGDQAAEVTLGSSIVTPISRFLLSHEDGTRYEAAFSASTIAAPFIVLGAKPVLLLTTVNAQPFVNVAQLRRDQAARLVRYVFTETTCKHVVVTHAACSQAMQWVRKHARDVTAAAGLPAAAGLLYDLDQPPA
jgi:4-amino-4-deoxy-L-arabinose transferase-like glycosyltransferase